MKTKFVPTRPTHPKQASFPYVGIHRNNGRVLLITGLSAIQRQRWPGNRVIGMVLVACDGHQVGYHSDNWDDSQYDIAKGTVIITCP